MRELLRYICGQAGIVIARGIKNREFMRKAADEVETSVTIGATPTGWGLKEVPCNQDGIRRFI
jgi:hypothetical protein